MNCEGHVEKEWKMKDVIRGALGAWCLLLAAGVAQAELVDALSSGH